MTKATTTLELTRSVYPAMIQYTIRNTKTKFPHIVDSGEWPTDVITEDPTDLLALLDEARQGGWTIRTNEDYDSWAEWALD